MVPRQPNHQSSSVISEGLQTILDLIQCIVCLDYFTAEGSDRAPRLLDCSHSFCLSCCRDLASSKLRASLDEDFIPCPVCRTVTYLGEEGIEGLRPNLTAIGLLDVPLLVDMCRRLPDSNMKRSLDTSSICTEGTRPKSLATQATDY